MYVSAVGRSYLLYARLRECCYVARPTGLGHGESLRLIAVHLTCLHHFTLNLKLGSRAGSILRDRKLILPYSRYDHKKQ